MRQFDLLPYATRNVGALSSTARRRLILVLHLIKDPILILVDDPFAASSESADAADALANYQLISALRDHVRRNARMALVTMRAPRSDIYQLLDQLTLLFHGEVVFSGEFMLCVSAAAAHISENFGDANIFRSNKIYASLLQSNWLSMSGERESGCLLS